MVEGLLIAAYAVGANEAIIAVRHDWTDAITRLQTAAREATEARLAGYLVFGTDTSIQLSVWEGSGAYVAGEEITGHLDPAAVSAVTTTSTRVAPPA